MDANDWLRQLKAMMTHNIAAPFGDSFEEVAKQVKAKLMVVAARKTTWWKYPRQLRPRFSRRAAHGGVKNLN
jgi:homoserine acetyltransferase